MKLREPIQQFLHRAAFLLDGTQFFTLFHPLTIRNCPDDRDLMNIPFYYYYYYFQIDLL